MQFIRIEEVLRMTGVRRTKFYALVKEGVFPKPRKLSPRTAIWIRHEIEDCMRKIAEAK